MYLNLKRNIDAWRRIGTPEHVIDWIENGIKLQFVKSPPSIRLSNPPQSKEQYSFIDAEVEDLLKNKIIRKCDPGEIPYCVSPIRAVSKKGGKYRLITNLQQLNLCVDVPKFSQEGIEIVAEQLEPNDLLLTVDLKSGFHHCMVHPDSQKYLGFYHKGAYFVWQALPYGLKSSPYYFNKYFRPVVQFLRENDLRVSLWVDDYLLMSRPVVATDNKDFLLHTFQDLGLSVNYDKSDLEQDTTKDYVGYTVDTVGNDGIPILKIKKDRLRKLKRTLRRLLQCGDILIARKLAQVAGQCVSMTRAILPGKLLLRNVYRVLKTRTSWDSNVLLDSRARKDLEWWLHALDQWNGAPIKLQPVDIQITTDASSDGWGAVLSNLEASGLWNARVSHMSSNARELLAIHMAILSFSSRLRGKCVQVLSDNVTACAYINNLGGPSQDLTTIATSLWVDCHDLGITLRAKHLAGTANTHADRLSRWESPYEWKLHPGLFRYIDSMYGPHTIDRFASLTTSQLAKYNSLYYDPYSHGVDALGQTDWGQELNFVNAPFFLLPKVVEIVKQQQAEATIIAPWWPAQPWFQQIKSMAVCPPMLMPKSKRVVVRLGPKLVEPLKNPRWRLAAWRVSGKPG